MFKWCPEDFFLFVTCYGSCVRCGIVLVMKKENASDQMATPFGPISSLSPFQELTVIGHIHSSFVKKKLKKKLKKKKRKSYSSEIPKHGAKIRSS